MHLILKRPVAQFAEPAKEELARESVERFSFVQADEHPPPKRFVAKVLQHYVEYKSPLYTLYRFRRTCSRGITVFNP